jgi:putative ABC transport system substrate-binding protein
MTGSLLTAPLAAGAQQAANIARIGYLAGNLASNPHQREAFLEGLRDLGYVEGRNVVIDYRFAEGRFERLPAFAAELVALKVDVILAGTVLIAVAAKQAIKTIPIVFLAVADPVGSGLVASLAQPGGNVTGLSVLTKLSPRGSKRFCPAHLRRNREYQAAYRQALRRRR